MNVTTGGVVLFLHITVAIVAFSLAGVLHAALHTMARARTVAEMRSWSAMVHRLEPLLPVMALLLLGLGAWLIHLSGGEISWSDGWIVTSVVTLIAVEAAAGMLLAPRSKALVAGIAEAADGEAPRVRVAALDSVIWDLAHVATFAFLGVVFLMAAKPSGAWSVAFPVVGAVVGVAASRLQLRAAPVQLPSDAVVPGQRADADRSERTAERH
jgi:hypothetical protein